jgi:hypothetical protein
VARGRRAGSVNPEDEPSSPTDAAVSGDDVIDPLRIAFDDLDSAGDGPESSTTLTPVELPDAYDPLAVLRTSIEDGAGFGTLDEDPSKRRRFGRRKGKESSPTATFSPADDLDLSDVPAARETPAVPSTDEYADLYADDAPVTESRADLPRVTTWADDLADDTFSMEPWATGEIPVVRDVAADSDALSTSAPIPVEPPTPRRGEGRRGPDAHRFS